MGGDAASSRLGAFRALGAGMATLGLAVGLTFPAVAPLMGVAPDDAASLRFRFACLVAGGFVGLANWLLAKVFIGRRLRRLSEQMATVGEQLRASTSDDRWTGTSPVDHRLDVTADDDLGRTAAAFNDLLAAIESERRFRSLVQATSDVICLVDGDGTVRFVSSSITPVLGWSPEDVVGLNLADVLHEDDEALDEVLARDWDVTDGPQAAIRVRDADGSWRRLEASIADRRHDDAVGAVVITCRDATERHELQVQLEHQATHDSLTDLPNRLALRRHAEGVLGGDTAVAVLVMDLDGFKSVNDTLGHGYGDRLLQEVSERLLGELRTGDLLARLGGDEFAVVLSDLDADEAAAAGRRMLATLEQPVVLDGLELRVEASMGLEHVVAGSAADIDDLLRNADIAMYSAKELKTGLESYAPEDDTHSRSRLVLLSQFRHALATDELELHYQPKVFLPTHELAGVEALVRWRHPDRGLLSPGAFLPMVEQTGLIDQMTDATLHLALEQARRWLDDGVAVPVAVNLSARCLRTQDLPDRVEAALAAHGVPAALLRLELTESALILDPRRAMESVRRLHETGVTFSIDDFGTGYSSMSYLRRLPVDELKIDASFVSTMASSDEDAALVRSVVDLAHNLGLEVVAEGVEDDSTAELLRDLRCDVAQGYHFERPVPAEELDDWLLRRPRDVDEPAA